MKKCKTCGVQIQGTHYEGFASLFCSPNCVGEYYISEGFIEERIE